MMQSLFTMGILCTVILNPKSLILSGYLVHLCTTIYYVGLNK